MSTFLKYSKVIEQLRFITTCIFWDALGTISCACRWFRHGTNPIWGDRRHFAVSPDLGHWAPSAPLPTAQWHSPSGGHTCPRGSSPGWQPWANSASSHWCLWTWQGTAPGVSRAFQCGSKHGNATTGDFQTFSREQLCLSEHPQCWATHSLDLPIHTLSTLTCKLDKVPYPQRTCCTSVMLIYGLFMSGGKEKSHSKSKQPLLQQLLRTQLRCRKLNFTTVQRCAS